MEIKIGTTSSNPVVPKRSQKYFRFQLRQGDEALFSQLSDEHLKALQSRGTYNERAEQLGVALGTVRSRLHRARARLDELRRRETGISVKAGAVAH